MVSQILFWIGLVLGAILFIVDFFVRGETKKYVAAFPFFLVLAAAVAKFLAS